MQDPHAGVVRPVTQVSVPNGDDGLSLDIIGAGLIIVEISKGAVMEHNASAQPDRVVKVNDIITSVSGEMNPFSMLEILQNEREFTLHITHPTCTRVFVEKVSGNLGLNLKYNPGSTCMEISRVLAGDVKDYNAKVTPEKQVYPGSLIVAVNGQSNSVLRMRNELKGRTTIMLGLLYIGTLRHISV